MESSIGGYVLYAPRIRKYWHLEDKDAGMWKPGLDGATNYDSINSAKTARSAMLEWYGPGLDGGKHWGLIEIHQLVSPGKAKRIIYGDKE